VLPVLDDRRADSVASPVVISRLLLVAYLVEAGLLLVIGPWSALWERNVFVQFTGGWAHDLVRSGWVRGGISGVGVLCVAAGIAELASLIGRRAARAAPDGSPGPAPGPASGGAV
jgi:hypothetical protein